MKIAIIDNSVAVTGAFKCALNEADVLSSKHSFIFIINTNSSLEPVISAKGYKTYRLPFVEIKKSAFTLLVYPFYLLINTIRLRRILKSEKIDILQVNDFYNLLGASAKLLGYKGKLITYVRFLPNTIPSALRKLWIYFANKYSHKVIAVSDAVLNQLPHSNKNIRIYDPANLQENLPTKKYENTETVQFLYLANYIKGKGQDACIRAFHEAYKTKQNIRLKFIGGDMGLHKNRQFRAELEQYAKDNHLENIILFNEFNTNVEDEIKRADISLNFSEAESFSMTCLESAYYGTPLIATNCGGPGEIIVDKETGLLVPVGDMKRMAEAILLLAGDSEQRTKLALRGKEYVRTKFALSNFITEFETTIR